ncbi:MAG TPA: dihydroxy-acid dehydratase [Candidatus Methylomirabilis sp.]|nr:dihydroxy-acid dehydratase [Candidatus Methylomirabilis sp.]
MAEHANDGMTLRSQDLHEPLDRTAHRALLHAVGITHDNMAKPLVAIVNSWTEVVPGHLHLRALGELVKEGVREAGGNPLEFDTIALCDGMAQGHAGMGFSLPSREAIADTVEIMVEGHRFDAAVMLSSCDKVEPAHLMAALRVNIPTVILTGGPMEGGRYKEHSEITLSTMREFAGQVKIGKLTREELIEIEKAALPGPGSCSMLGTANTMGCLIEVLGMSPPGCGTMLAVDPRRPALAREAGRLVLQCLRSGLTPRRIVTREALQNAMAADMALGGSTNSVLHLLAIAHEAGIPLDLDEFDAVSRRVPHLCNVKPSGSYAVGRLDEAGGIPALLMELAPVLHLDLPTVTGKTLRENIAGAAVTNREMIRPLSSPLHPEGGLAILRGSLAPEGAVVKQSGVRFQRMLAHRGPARVFENMEEAVRAFLADVVQPGDVVVVRYEGPKGGPGMREMHQITSIMVGMGLDEHCGLVTDGRFSGSTRGPCIGHISPEAAEGGPIALVRDGDMIDYDIPNRRLNLRVPAEELDRRRAVWKPPKRELKGILARYARLAESASRGAVLRQPMDG